MTNSQSPALPRKLQDLLAHPWNNFEQGHSQSKLLEPCFQNLQSVHILVLEFAFSIYPALLTLTLIPSNGRFGSK